MAPKRQHYEQAFEHYLRRHKLPFVSVAEAKKAVLGPAAEISACANGAPATLKSFDFVLYGKDRHLLVEVKGRKVGPAAEPGCDRSAIVAPSRLESWVTLDDVESLRNWQRLFGPPFTAVFAFVYWCDTPDQAVVIGENFDFADRGYALRLITIDDYQSAMKTRSPRWRTVNLTAAAFERLSRPLLGGAPARGSFGFRDRLDAAESLCAGSPA